MGRSHRSFTLRSKSLLTPGNQIFCPLLSSVCALTPHLLQDTHPIVTIKKKNRGGGVTQHSIGTVRVKSLDVSRLLSNQQRRTNKNRTQVTRKEAGRVNTCPGRAFESSLTVSSLPRPADRCRRGESK